jgi:CheY-like chemotaxis protein
MPVVPRVLLVSPKDLSAQLGQTVLWRQGIERLFAHNSRTGLELARQLLPNLIVADAVQLPDTPELLQSLRRDEATRRISLAAIPASSTPAAEEALRRAGANLVLPTPLEPGLWDPRLEELLDVPPRREARLRASFQLWCRADPQDELHEAVVLNISVRGMLIETREPLPIGSTVDLRLSLPGDGGPLPLIGLVVRSSASQPERFYGGVQFLILRDQVKDRIRSYIEADATK